MYFLLLFKLHKKDFANLSKKTKAQIATIILHISHGVLDDAPPKAKSFPEIWQATLEKIKGKKHK